MALLEHGAPWSSGPCSMGLLRLACRGPLGRGEPHRSLEAASQPCGHTSHCPFALTAPFPAAETGSHSLPLLEARTEGHQETRGHPSSHLSVPRDPEWSSAAAVTRALFPGGLLAKMPGHLPAARPGRCGPHPGWWARRVRGPPGDRFLGP